MVLTAEQADSFLTEKLGIKNWRSKIEHSQLELLYEVDKRFKQVVYYENISWGAKEFTELKPETEKSCIESILQGGGGVCLQNNYFMYLLLKSMGFDTFVVGCKWTAIEGFGSDDLYLLDVGWVRPIPCPVHLNRLPFTYKAAGFEIRFQLNSSENKYETFLFGGDPLKGSFLDDAPFRKYGSFDLIPREFKDFDVPMNATFTNPDQSLGQECNGSSAAISYFQNFIVWQLNLEFEEIPVCLLGTWKRFYRLSYHKPSLQYMTKVYKI